MDSASPPPPLSVELVLPDLGLPVVSTDQFTYHISDWQSLLIGPDKTYSPTFQVAGFNWRILLFPKGNRDPDYISIFIESIDAGNVDKEIDGRWHVCAQFAIAVVKPGDPTVFKHSTATHRFTPANIDWGFNMMVRHDVLLPPTASNAPISQTIQTPILADNSLDIIVYISIIRDETGVLWHDFVNYDSKKETGLVGLRNQGATCYMNSLLQSLYFTSYFRKATFEIPTEGDSPTSSIALALQRIFYNLSQSDEPVGTTELTRSFGWDALDSFMQHDVQEFNRVLQDNLETKMKGTKAEGAISRLFVGVTKSFIKCIDVDYESSRGCKDLDASFVEYCEIETLTGENKYSCEGLGLQDARKGVIFKKFPPVFHMQLKRFEYDMQHDAMVKINDRHEFPLEIDLDSFLEKDSDRSSGTKFSLHGVLVHSGDLSAGHYMAFIRPEINGRWFKFDDDRVTPVTEKEALEDNYGDNSTQLLGSRINAKKRSTNAYMLVYIRNTDLDHVLARVTDVDIPGHLRERLEAERMANERTRREAEEMHLFINVRVVSDADIARNCALDLYDFGHRIEPGSFIGGVRANSVTSISGTPSGGSAHLFKVRRSDTFQMFKATVMEHYGLHDTFRLWTIFQRKNMTNRVEHPLSEIPGGANTMEDIYNLIPKQSSGSLQVGGAELRLYLEVPDSNISGQLMQSMKIEVGIILFLKYYEPSTGTLEYAGKISVPDKGKKIADIIPILYARKGLSPDTPLLIYEEVKVGIMDLLKHGKTFSHLEIGDGDILCYQREISDVESAAIVANGGCPTIPDHFTFLANRITVLFKEFPADGGIDLKEHKKPLHLTLSKKTIYDSVAEQVAQLLGNSTDPEKLRFTNANTSGLPKSIIKRTPALTLVEMLSTRPTAGSNMYILFFEKLDQPLKDYTSKRLVKVSYVSLNQSQHGPFELLVNPLSNFDEIVLLVKERVKVSVEVPVRIFEMNNGRVHALFQADEPLSKAGDIHWGLVVQETAQEDSANDGVSYDVVHYNKQVSRFHGIPFTLYTHRTDTFAQVCARIKERLALSEKEFVKIKVGIVGTGESSRVPADDAIFTEVVGEGEVIGLDHADKTAKIFEKPLIINKG